MDALALAGARPHAYHLTARSHLELLRRDRRLDSAERLCIAAGRLDLLRQRRLVSEEVSVNGFSILIRDQLPLHESRMDLRGRPFSELLRDINRRVFFWAGKSDGAGTHCEAHFKKYAAERPVILRVPMADLLKGGVAHLCRYNSGSPRHSPQDGKGRPSPRGPDTFIPLQEWSAPAREVVEVTFVDGVALPETTQWSDDPLGPWRRLFGQNG